MEKVDKLNTDNGFKLLFRLYFRKNSSELLGFLKFNAGQDPVYSKNELQSQSITFRRHHSDIYLYFPLFVFSVYSRHFLFSFFSVSPSYNLLPPFI